MFFYSHGLSAALPGGFKVQRLTTTTSHPLHIRDLVILYSSYQNLS